MLARAKINLYLHVVGRRADGYHLLDSLIVFAETGDKIAAAPAAELSLKIDGPFAGKLVADADNLVLRAARGLQELTGTKAGAAITLTKNLPVASGIGGGSADAATTLQALAALWKVIPDQDALAKLALGLGADVPVCLAGRPSFIGGIGEEIMPVGKLPAAHLLLVNPGIATPTPAVFKTRTGGFSPAARWSEPPRDAAALAHALGERRNDLTEAAIRVTPAIRDVLAAIAATRHVLLTRLSGSGATCFGLYATAEAAAVARDAVRAAHHGWWAVAAPIAK
ncbi:MAG TPA: 4-(cytidine 5'-diphospho)-2-C-methyl-D-erythritol kinase [Candidatus Binatia bacterium]|nr:4-(cytidine 5'-diphospho)-2-C-methyl-D-erythritol kinase [Candidatus Binatia bacterium]